MAANKLIQLFMLILVMEIFPINFLFSQLQDIKMIFDPPEFLIFDFLILLTLMN